MISTLSSVMETAQNVLTSSASTVDPEQDLIGFMQALGSIDAFSATEYTDRLKSALLTTPRMQSLKSYFQSPIKTQTDCNFGHVDCSARVQDLGTASTAVAISNFNDSRNFHALTNGTNAAGVPDSKIQVLITCLFADHLNRGLVQQHQPDLEARRQNPQFVALFNKKIRGPGFDPFTGRPDAHYALACLFVAEYFQKGPDFTMPTNVSQVSCMDVLDAWRDTQARLWVEQANVSVYARNFAFLASSLFSPTGLASTPLEEYALNLQIAGHLLSLDSHWNSEIQGSIKDNIQSVARRTIFDKINLDGFQSLSHDLLYTWNIQLRDVLPSSFWVAGIVGAENDKQVDDRDNGSDPYHVFRTTTYGYNIMNWRNSNQDMPYVNKGVSVNNSEHHFIYKRHTPARHGGGSCFLPGTQVFTNKGPVAIENLYEGCRILTDASPMQWGVESSELVKSPAPPVVYGFNSEGAFFTAGHVFHTTTGLRAVDPHLAREENPWLDVGTLRVGHWLLQLSENTTYKHVQIRSIEQHETQESYVYGVHLREGLRSYHANGYRVALNYPEITASAVAEQLRTIPQGERLSLLSCFKELRPLLARFGGDTILQVLDQETSVPSLSFGGKRTSTRRFLTRDLHMPYVAYETGTHKKLLRLELYSGVLRVDGVHCERAVFEKDSLYWTRPLKDDSFEHGYCRLSKNGLQGDGRIFRSASLDPSVEEMKQNLQRLQLVPEAPSVALEAGDDDLWRFSFSYDTRPFDDREPITTWQPNQSFGSATCTIEDGGVDYTTFGFDQYTQIWAALVAHAKSQVSDPKAQEFFASSPSLFDVYQSTDAHSDLVIELEALHSDQILQASDQYIAWMKANPNPSQIQKEVPIHNLTFSNIGMDPKFTLPLLIQRYRIKPGPFGDTPTGVITEFNPFMRGNSGTAHWIAGTADYADSSTLLEAIAQAPHTVNAFGQISVHSEPDPISRSLASTALNDDDDVVTALASLTYDQNDVNSAVQIMIGQIMAYHMNDKDRACFIGSKPTVGTQSGQLPPQYADQLDSATAAWMRGTYAPAYICQVLAQNDSSIRDSLKFTDKERKSIRYFWNGQGSSCLSRADVYKVLERSVTRYVIRSKYKAVSNAYDTNNSATGIKYSDLLFSKSTKPGALGQFGTEKNDSGCSKLTKLGAIMDALDAGNENDRSRQINDGTTKKTIKVKDTNSNCLVFQVIAFQKYKGWNNPYWGNPNLSDDQAAAQLQEEWLIDGMADIVQKLLENDQTLTGTVLGQMGADIEAWGKQQPAWDQMSMKEKCLKVTGALGVKIRNFILGLAKTWGWVKQGGSWIITNMKSLIWKDRSQRMVDVADEIANEGTPSSIKIPLVKGLLFTLGAVVLGAQLWQISDQWATASVDKRGLLILGVFSAFNQLAGFGVDFVEAILEYRGKSAFSSAFRRLTNAQWDKAIGKFGKDTSFVARIDKETGDFVADDGFEVETSFADALEKQDTKAIESEWEFVNSIEDNGFDVALNDLSAAESSIISTQRAFAAVRIGLQVFGYLIAIGVAIFMTWQLVKQWHTLDTGDKIFQTIQVVLACAEAVGAAVILSVGAAAVVGFALSATLGIGGAFAVGAATAFFAMASVFATVAVVLAVVAVLVMVAMFIYLFTKAPPLNDAEVFVKERGRPFADRQDLVPPPAPCSVTVNPTSFNSSLNNVQSIQLTFRNTSNAEMTVQALQVDLSSGNSTTGKDNYAALFHDNLPLVLDASKKDKGFANIVSNLGEKSHATFQVVNHQSDVDPSTYNISLRITGPAPASPLDDQPPFILQPNEVLVITAYGTIYAHTQQDGKNVQTSLSWTQLWTQDSAQQVITDTIMIDRAVA